MSDKYNNETLRQQRKAREEFLKLKKMQNGEISLPEPTAQKAPETLKEKSENFWYYNRYKILSIVLIIVITAICVTQCVMRPDYDLTVTIYTSSLVGDDDCKEIEQFFKNISEDVNGDGSINVQVINCSYNENGNREILYATKTKFQAIVASEQEYILFITDEYSYNQMNSISSDTNFFDDDTLILPDSFYNLCESKDLYELPRELFITKRIVSQSVLNKNENVMRSYGAADSVLEKLKNVE